MNHAVRLLGRAAVLLALSTPLLRAQSPTPLAANGRLQVINRQLCNEAGAAIQLRGMSSHGLHWFDNCFTQSSVQTLATDWGIDVFRAAMYIESGGYASNPAGLRAKVNQIVDWSAAAGIYCIIDWHILENGNPNARLAEAKDFFRTMAQTHAGKKHVIYELCNEPNGVDWPTIKSYAEAVIPEIRQFDPTAIILVGTPQWSGLPGDVRTNPLTGSFATNVMYTFHFYAGSHYSQAYIRDVLQSVPLFVSEWGTSNFTGNGGNDYANAQAWVDLMGGNNPAGIKVSWCNWSFCDKDESSAALQPGACGSGAWNNTSTSGTWVKQRILSPADSWGGTPPPPGNQSPTVSLTAPANGATFTAPATINLTATASDADGNVAKVEFFQGTTKLGEDASAPYQFAWSNVGAGSYSLTARATDNAGAVTTSAAVGVTVNGSTPPPTGSGDILGPDCAAQNAVLGFEANATNRINATAYSWWCTGSTQSVTPVAGQPHKVTINFGPSFTGGDVCVGINYSAAPWHRQFCKTVARCTGTPPPPPANQAPSVGLTGPANGATFTAPASIGLTATASDADGSVAKVEFFNGGTKLGEDESAPYQFTWSNVASGNYSLTARATDNAGATATSAAVNVTVNAPANQAPTVSLTSPASGATFTAPASINLSATASDADGSIGKVEFFNGGTKLGEDDSAPFQFAWTNVSAGSYSLTAKATDNAGATATSAAVSVTVNGSTPPPPTGDLLGPDCAAANAVLTYELNAANRTNATAYSWWCTGSTASISSPAGQPFKTIINFGPWFNGGEVCVGVNYSAAPWHRQFCKPVAKCGTARLSAEEWEEAPASLVFPNPASEGFTFVADRPVRSLRVFDALGRQHLSAGALGAGQRLRFGERLEAGSYLLRIDYTDQTGRTVKVVKVGR